MTNVHDDVDTDASPFAGHHTIGYGPFQAASGAELKKMIDAGGVPGPAGPAGPQGPVGPASTVPGPSGPPGSNGATGAGYDGITSVSSLTAGFGSQTAVLNKLGAIGVGHRVRFAVTASPTTIWGEGIVTAINTGAVSITVNVDMYLGSGTGTGPWSIAIIGQPGLAEQWFNGSGAPAGSLGNIGDMYLDNTSGDVYEKIGSSAWTKRGNIKGPAGDAGSAVNVILNNSFEVWDGIPTSNMPDGNLANWSTFWATGATLHIVKKGVGRDITSARIEFGSNGVQRLQSFPAIPTRAGEIWYVSAWARKPAGGTNPSMTLEIYSANHNNPQPFDPNTHAMAALSSTVVSAAGWTLYEGQVTIPSPDTFLCLMLTGGGTDNTSIIEFDQITVKSLSPPASSLVPYPTWNALDGLVGAAAGSTPVLALPYPGGVSKPDGPTQFKALADRIEAVIARPNLPNPVWATGPATNDLALPAGSYNSLTTPVSAAITLTQPCYVRIDWGAWHVVNSVGAQEMRTAINLTGSLVQAPVAGPETHGMAATFARNNVATAATLSTEQNNSIVVLAPAGTLVAEIVGYLNGPPATARANYATLRITPLYYQGLPLPIGFYPPVTDTGWVNSDAGWAAPAGWAIVPGSYWYRKYGESVSVRGSFQKISSTLATGDGGDMANIAVLSAVPSIITPSVSQALTAFNSGRLCSTYMGNNGTIVLAAVAPNTSNLIAVNETFSFSGSYLM